MRTPLVLLAFVVLAGCSNLTKSDDIAIAPEPPANQGARPAPQPVAPAPHQGVAAPARQVPQRDPSPRAPSNCGGD